MEALFYKLFCKRKRRIQVMLLWHSRQPVSGKTAKDVLQTFFKLILDAEICVTITPNRIFFFHNEPGLSLTYDQLAEAELSDLYTVYERRHCLFDSVARYQDGSWKLSEMCKEPVLSDVCRKELLRDFVHYALGKKPEMRIDFIYVTQLLIEYNDKRGDRFVRNLHDKLQGKGNINNLLVIYD